MKPQLETYQSLCTEVYDLSKPTPPKDAYEFYCSYMEKAKGPILEPMCGTGRFLLPLLEEGFNIHGFDASEPMLEALYNKAKAKNLSPHVEQRFVEDFSSSERYDLIFIPSGSFCLITEQAQVKTALKTFYNHLRDGGILLFEGETPQAAPPLGIWRGSTWRKPDGQIILLSCCASLEGTVCSSICKYELVDKGQILRTEVENLRVRLYLPEEMTALLEEAGFRDIRVLKAFDKAL